METQTESTVAKQVRMGRTQRDRYFGTGQSVECDGAGRLIKRTFGNPVVATNDASSVRHLYGNKSFVAAR